MDTAAVPVLAPKQLTFVCDATDMVSVAQAVTVQGGIDANVVNVNVTPDDISVTFMGNTDAEGADTVAPEAVQVGTVTPAQIKGIQLPPGHAEQLTDVVVLDQVYVPAPPDAVMEPEFVQRVTVPQALTLTVVVPVPQAKLYVITKEPTPAVAGLNVPKEAFVMPVPLQVPPAVAAIKLNAGDVKH